MTNALMILFEPDFYVWGLLAVLTALSVATFFLCRRMRRRWLRWACLLLLLLPWYVLLYGTFVGVRQLEVRHVEFTSEDLPAVFDGYRIVQFSDAHVSSFTGWRRQILQRAMDSINAQQGDMIVFTGDLQNKQPAEIGPHGQLLACLKAKDGVYSVLGNHDYPMYVACDSCQRKEHLNKTIALEKKAGWKVLRNSHSVIRRGGDSIVIAGMENDGEGRFPQLGDIGRTLRGVSPQAFVVMLEHSPTAWRRRILPQSHSQLTLSGHTHGGQFALLGCSPTVLHYSENGGMYYEGDRAINVSTGLGGVIPIRFGVPPEIVVITLRKK